MMCYVWCLCLCLCVPTLRVWVPVCSFQVAQWTVAFLVWTPWQKFLAGMTEAIRSSVGGKGQGFAVFGCIASLGIGVTTAIAMASAVVHSDRGSVVARIGYHLERRPLVRRMWRGREGAHGRGGKGGGDVKGDDGGAGEGSNHAASIGEEHDAAASGDDEDDDEEDDDDDDDDDWLHVEGDDEDKEAFKIES